MKRRKARIHPGTVIDSRALPPELRTRVEKNYDEGTFTTIEPVTVLSRAGFRVVAEVVRVRDCFDERDSHTYFDIRLVDPRPSAEAHSCFLSVEYDPSSPSYGAFGDFLVLLEDAETYIQGLESE